ERRDPIRPRRPDAGADRRALPGARAMPHQAQRGIVALQFFDLGDGAVARPVIDVDDLVIDTTAESGGDFTDQRRDVRRFVAHGDDDGEVHKTIDEGAYITANLPAIRRRWH